MEKAPEGKNRQRYHIERNKEILWKLNTRQYEILYELVERHDLSQHAVHELTGLPQPLLSSIYKMLEVKPSKRSRGGREHINSIRIARAKALAVKEYGPELDAMRAQFGISYGP